MEPPEPWIAERKGCGLRLGWLGITKFDCGIGTSGTTSKAAGVFAVFLGAWPAASPGLDVAITMRPARSVVVICKRSYVVINQEAGDLTRVAISIRNARRSRSELAEEGKGSNDRLITRM